jgi:hypothetical protein
MKRLICILAILIVTFNLSQAQSRRQPGVGKVNQESSNSIQPTAAGNAVTGSGTPGRLSRWTGVDGSNTFTLGNSIVFEDKFGKVGIGTTTPTSLLTVRGMIETTLGGYKFPDGTIQTTAAVGGLQFVFTDSTLRGDGTSSFPLGVNIPLTLTADRGSEFLLVVRNVGERGNGIQVIAGDSPAAVGIGGIAVEATGGDSSIGGEGMVTRGGFGSISGGVGARAIGGSGDSGPGNDGIVGVGGDSNSNNGGSGAAAFGGLGSGAGHSGGTGIIAQGGIGSDGATTGLAGRFIGDVTISGNLSKGGGSFKIDHPLDPENKYLYHSFVESPDMMNIYNGNAVTNANGEAIVELPSYFQALNRDFRYQLTVIGQFAQAIIGEEIKGNHFMIKTSAANVKVSWQVTGVRQDAYANKNRISVEVVKSETERGFYLHPDAFHQPEEKSVLLVEHPEVMRQVQERRDKAQKARRD